MRPTLRDTAYWPHRARQPFWMQAARLAGQHRAIADLIREGKANKPHGGDELDFARSALRLSLLAQRSYRAGKDKK